MSLERYVTNQNINREVNNIRKIGQSPINAFARMLIDDATTELISIERGSNSPMGSVLSMDRPRDNRRQLQVHKRKMEAMIYFGNIIIAMENTVIDGTYNHQEFIDNVNHSLGSFAKYDNDFPIAEVEKDEDKVSASDLRNIAKANPTLSTFMSYPDDWLPPAILRILEERKIYNEVFDMAADYEEVANRLVQEGTNGISDRQIQSITLDFFDRFIEEI